MIAFGHVHNLKGIFPLVTRNRRFYRHKAFTRIRINIDISSWNYKSSKFKIYLMLSSLLIKNKKEQLKHNIRREAVL